MVLGSYRLVGAAGARRRLARHALAAARERVWRDRNTDEVRAAQRHADYAYRLAVDPPAAKELRLFGLAGWTIDRFVARRRRLHRAPVAGDPSARAAGGLEPAAGDRRQRRGVLVAGAATRPPDGIGLGGL